MSTNNEVIIIAEETNGETTVVEIIATDADTLLAKDSDGDTLIEEVIEAVLDQSDDSETEATIEEYLEATDAELTTSSSEVAELNETDADLVSAGEFDVATSGFDPQPNLDTAFEPAMPASFDATEPGISSEDFVTFEAGAGDVGVAGTYSDAATESNTETTGTGDPEIDAETQGDFDLATEAQAKADEAIEAGDYEAAAQYREDAEDAAWQAGDDSMLHGSDASDLTMADSYQDKAADLEEQQAAYAEAGDYEAARDASRDAATYTQWGDIEGGGADHSAEAQHEYAQMDTAAWQQDIADGYQQDAEAYAAQGDLENAEMYQAEASEHQDTADYYGDLGEHNGTYDQYEDVPDAAYSGYDSSTDYASADYSSTDYSSSYSSYDSSSEAE